MVRKTRSSQREKERDRETKGEARGITSGHCSKAEQNAEKAPAFEGLPRLVRGARIARRGSLDFLRERHRCARERERKRTGRRTGRRRAHCCDTGPIAGRGIRGRGAPRETRNRYYKKKRGWGHSFLRAMGSQWLRRRERASDARHCRTRSSALEKLRRDVVEVASRNVRRERSDSRVLANFELGASRRESDINDLSR